MAEAAGGGLDGVVMDCRDVADEEKAAAVVASDVVDLTVCCLLGSIMGGWGSVAELEGGVEAVDLHLKYERIR